MTYLQRGRRYLRNRIARYNPRTLMIHAAAWWAHQRRQRTPLPPHLTEIDAAAYRASRRSDTVFIFGSGPSVQNIRPEEWEVIEKHSTFSFSMFVFQEWVRIDYHMLRELYIKNELNKRFWLPYTQEFVEHFDHNPRFNDTILLAQCGRSALVVNRLLNLDLLRKPRRLLFFETTRRGASEPPTASFEEGITHGAGSLTDAINLAALGGWQHLVLVGVDLTDFSYFWGDDHDTGNERIPTRGVHNTVNLGIVEQIGMWRDILAERGQTLWVQNPKSLLAQVLPIYDVLTSPSG